MLSIAAYTRYVLLIALLAGTGGCAPDPAASPAADPPAAQPDRKGTPPQDWTTFLQTAHGRLSELPPPIPPPATTAPPDPAHQVIRLDEQIDRAKMETTWQPPRTDRAALVELGPFRSDQPSPTLRVQRSNRPGQPALRLTVRGFEIQREQVGAVSLEIRLPTGRHFDLVWARAGRIRVPVPDNDRCWPLRLTTDGLASWHGPLKQLRLEFDELPAAPIEIRSLRLLRRIDAFPRPVGVRRVNVDRETRPTLYVHPPGRVTWPELKVPPGARFQAGLGLIAPDRPPQPGAVPDGPSPAGRFRLLIEQDGQRTTLLDHRIEAGRAWLDQTVDLDRWAGQTISLTLEVDEPSGATVACWGTPVIHQAVKDPPCVVIYLIDALGAGHIDLYGYPRPTMPRLAGLAARGAWFANAYSNSSRTVESVPDLMLSMPAERHGVIHASVQAPESLVTLAEVLQSAGFATASFCTNVNAGPRQAMDRGFDHFFDRIAYWWDGQVDRTVPLEDVRHWLEVHRDRPTFLYIHTAEPHAPYLPPPAFAGRFDAGYAGPINGSYDRERGFRSAKSRSDLAHVVALYDAEIAYADARLGAFLDALAEDGRSDRTHLLVTADHGEQFLEHGHWEHGRDLHNELTRIPLVAVGPRFTARGRHEEPAQLYDLMPTLLDLFDLPSPYPLAGRSLLPVLAGAAETLDRDLIVTSNHIYQPADFIEYAVIEGNRWKLLRSYTSPTPKPPFERFRLYNLRDDPTERRDVIDDHRNVARRLIDELLRWHADHPPLGSAHQADELLLDPNQLEELRSLGYID